MNNTASSLHVLFGGPAGAGKSALAQAWCNARKRAVHIQLDDIRNLIVAGLADPQEHSSLQAEQFDLSVRACCELAGTFINSGYNVAIDDVLLPGRAFELSWVRHLQPLEYRVVIVQPSLEETLSRASQRDKRVPESLIRQQYAECLGWPANVRIDTTGLSESESLALVEEMLSLNE